METNKLLQEFRIKGMVCTRCLKVLKNELRDTGAEVIEIKLGKVIVRFDPENIDSSFLKRIIINNEFDILISKEEILAEQTKMVILNYIKEPDSQDNLSEYISIKMGLSYNLISKNFSEVFHYTVERYFMILKVERAKELIEDGEINFSEISYLLGYNNLSALSRQFKKETGLTMKEYKQLKMNTRVPIDRI
jgi:AraC-like DNA-binding protein